MHRNEHPNNNYKKRIKTKNIIVNGWLREKHLQGIKEKQLIKGRGLRKFDVLGFVNLTRVVRGVHIADVRHNLNIKVDSIRN